ncbi:MAG: hypothetical protein GY758_34140 [Fuerstiella sp.]|nr:hypothetical protein [Fuerstiella sp.]
MDDGRWTMDDGRWTMDDGRWTIMCDEMESAGHSIAAISHFGRTLLPTRVSGNCSLTIPMKITWKSGRIVLFRKWNNLRYLFVTAGLFPAHPDVQSLQT